MQLFDPEMKEPLGTHQIPELHHGCLLFVQTTDRQIASRPGGWKQSAFIDRLASLAVLQTDSWLFAM